ncbi:MAG: phage tail fiber protein, partial [Candidatus Rokuibacteriota bacterium]
SDYLEQKLIDLALNKVAFTGPATHVALFTAAPSDAGAGTEVTGGAYARVLVNENANASTPKWKLGAASGGGFLVENLNAIAFAQATANWGEILAFGIFDAATAGNLLYWGFLSTLSYTFTAVAATDVFTAPGHTLANGDRVILKGDALPAGVSADTVYFVVGVSGSTFQLSLTSGGAAINLTADGAGVVHKLAPKTVTANDTFSFPADSLDIVEK